jgi:hypothetical protein
MRIAGRAVFQAMEIANKFEDSLNSQRRGNRRQDDSAAAALADGFSHAAKPGTVIARPQNLVPVAALSGPTSLLPERKSGLIDEVV